MSTTSCTLTRTVSSCDLRCRPAGMLSRSTSSTRSSQAVFAPCFPSAEGSASLHDTRGSLPIRPRKKAVFDADACSIPIREFDDHAHSSYFAPRQHGVEADLPPAAQPEGFADDYLVPSLTRNERLRLTMCEYGHTQGILRTKHSSFPPLKSYLTACVRGNTAGMLTL